MSMDVSQIETKITKPMRIALALNGRTDVALSVREITWDQLCARLSTPKVGAKDGSYYVRGGDLVEPKRADENLKEAEVAVIDGDSSFDPETGELVNGAPPLEKTVKALEELGIAFFTHTTHSFRQDEDGRWVWKYRVLIPAKMKSPDELDAVVTYVIDALHQRGVFITDVPENRRWSQPWYMPRVAEKDDLAFFRSHKFDGIPIDVAEAVRLRDERRSRLAQEQHLPRVPPASVEAHKDGLGGTSSIDAFNDAHGLDFVRRTLETHGYRFVYLDKHGPGGEAYRYVRPNSSTGQPGVVVFKGSRGHWCVYSHHGVEDPLSSKVCDPFDLVAALEYRGDRKAAAKAILPKAEREPSIAELISARHTANVIDTRPQVPLETPPTAQPPQPQKRAIEIVMAHDLKDEPITWLIDNLVPAKGFAALYGKPGSYKSFVALYLAGMIATGQKAFDRQTTEGDVVYVAGEGGAGLKRRWDALKLHHRLPADARIGFVRSQLNLRSTLDDLEALIEAINTQALKPQLVIIDTLARAFAGGNENSSEDMGAFIAIMGQLQERLNTAVMIVHHSGKDEARGQRGHSSLLGAVDAELEVVKVSADESPERVGKLTVTKQKDGEDGYEIGYKMATVPLSQIDFEKTSLVVDPMPEAPQSAPKERKRRTGQNELLALQALRKAVDEGGRHVSSNHIPHDAKCVEIPNWRRYFGQISPLKDESARRSFDREVKRLGQLGQISVWGNYAWISDA